MKTLEIKPMPGDNISETCSQAAILAALKGKPVSFKFNDTVVVAQPGESSSVLQNRWHKDYEAATKAYRESPKYKAQQKKDAEDLKKKQSAKMKESASTAQDALYPQHNLPQKLHEAMEDWKPWLKEEAVKNLKDRSFAHPNVVAHWKKLAGDPK